MSAVTEAVRDGGLVMWAILGLGVMGSAISVERVYFVMRQTRIDGVAFMEQLQRAVLDDDLERALLLCSAAPDAALPRLLRAALVRAGRPETELREALEEERLALLPRLRRRVGLLPILARAAAGLGLIGTIHGLILALDAAGGAGGAVAFSAGAATALHSAMFSAVVAIPLVLAHGLISAQTSSLLDELDRYGFMLLRVLRAGRHPGGAQGGAPVLPFPG